MQNPFEDLIPPQNAQNQSASQNAQPENPFSDLIPAQNNVRQQTSQSEPSVSDRAMASFLHQQSPLGPTRNYDPMANNLSLPEKIGNFGVDFAAGAVPFQMGAGALMRYGGKILPKFAKFMQKDPYFASSALENSIAGAGYGAANDGTTGALTGGILGAISPLPSAAVNAGGKYIAEKVAQSAIPGLTSRATDYMRNLFSPEDYTSKLKNQFSKASSQNTANWNKVDEAAEALDNSLKSGTGSVTRYGQPSQKPTFDNSPYLKHIDDYVEKVNNLEPARRQEYSQALDFANEARQNAPQSVQGAVAAHKNLNQALSEFMSQKGMPAANRQAKEFVSGLKDNLKENMSNDFLDGRMKDLGYDQSFSDIWNKANKSHSDLQNFYKSPDKLGNIVKSKKLEQAMKGDTTEGSVIGQYSPKPSQTGTEGLDQLAENMGSKGTAQDAVQAYMNRRPLTNGVSTLDVSNEYAKLSPSQRSWIYGNSPQGKLLDTVNNVRQAFGKEPARSLLTAGTHHALSLGAPAAIGYFGSELAGGDKEQNLLTAASLMGGAGIGKYLSRRLSPEHVQALINYAKRSPANYGRYFNMPLQTAASGIYGGINQ
jgi:hypothetical protein